ncbi:MAG: hypothetical protein GXX92_09530 [Clostridiales bacterium]|jgi:hypothetical protein|nr:hypothetical protein [Clostridiales bacterium]
MIALFLLDYLYDEKNQGVLLSTLSSLRGEILRSKQIKLTPAEQEAFNLVMEKGLVTFEDISQLSDRFASFKHKSHTSVIMNSLLEKSIIGRIKKEKETFYVTPKEAVMWALKEVHKMPTEADPKEISDLTGLSIIRILDVLAELVI